MLDITKIKKIHFIGIGGIGVSGLAKIMLWQGKSVSGSDLVSSKNIKDLKRLGAKIFIGPHEAENVAPDLDLVIYTSAAEKDNSEILAAKKFGIKILSYAKVLGILTRQKFAICVSGTHGKTTTTSLISLVLAKAGLDPTCIIGSNLREFDGNARLGKSQYFVLEADEYKAAFLNYWPKIVILTAIEYEHPDYFRDLKHTINVYKEYVRHLPKDGILIANADDGNVMEAAKEAKCKIATYGIKKKADFTAVDVNLEGGCPEFELKTQNSELRVTVQNSEPKEFRLNIPGIHNIYNSLAMIALAVTLKIDLKIVQKVLENYHGAWRRFEYKKVDKKRNIVIIDDYGHHPTEIKVTLRAGRERFPKHKIICIFQPHQIKRTKILFNDFIKVFNDVDEVIVAKVYAVAGRDEGDRELYSKRLVGALKKKKIDAKYIAKFNEIADYIKKTVKKNCVIITMGAGDITMLSDRLVEELS